MRELLWCHGAHYWLLWCPVHPSTNKTLHAVQQPTDYSGQCPYIDTMQQYNVSRVTSNLGELCKDGLPPTAATDEIQLLYIQVYLRPAGWQLHKQAP
jgi:hypothetical protein